MEVPRMGNNHKKKKKTRKNGNYKRPEQLAQREAAVAAAASQERTPKKTASLVLSVLAIGVVLAIIVVVLCNRGPVVTPSHTTPTETSSAMTGTTEPFETTAPTESVPTSSEAPDASQPPQPSEPVSTEPVVTEPVVTEPQPSEGEPTEPSTEPTTPPIDTDPVFAIVKETVYINKNANIRSGPGEEFNALGGLLMGEMVTRIGIGDNGWSKIYKRGTESYIRSDFLQKEPLFENTSVMTEIGEVTFEEINELVYAAKTANVRNGPSVNSEDIGDLYEDDLILRIGVGDNGWSLIVYNGNVAYVRSDFLVSGTIQK
jgi:uncharacterized protein YgiM (DUF1202 family)